MPVIDYHEHIIPRRGFIPPDTGETIITAAEMVGIMDRHGMDRAVALPIATPDISCAATPTGGMRERLTP